MSVSHFLSQIRILKVCPPTIDRILSQIRLLQLFLSQPVSPFYFLLKSTRPSSPPRPLTPSWIHSPVNKSSTFCRFLLPTSGTDLIFHASSARFQLHTSSFIHLLSAFNPTLLLSSIFSLPLLPLSLTLFSYNSTPPTTSSRELSFLYPSTYSLPFPQSAAPQRTALQSADVGLA